MTITKRLLITLTLALLGMLLVGAYGIWQLNQAQSRFQYVQVNIFPSLQDMNDAQHALTASRVNSVRALLPQSDQSRAEALAAIADADKRFDAALADYRANDISNETDRQLLDADVNAMGNYRAARDRAMKEATAGNLPLATTDLLVNAKAAALLMTKAMDEHYQFNKDLAAGLANDNNRQYSNALLIMALTIGAALLVSGGMALALFSVIRGGLQGIRDTMSGVSQSLDFTRRAPVTRMDEIGHTALAFNALLERLQLSMRSLRGGAQEVASASQQLSQTASQVSSAASAQSESASDMAATLEQMTVSINHVAEQAGLTHNGSVEASQLVNEGSTIIGQTIHDIHEISTVVKSSVTRIHELETYSTQVSAVINVIREIADQTNLLALNAAIEAARAGETGRGFAVVADEVRKLAERTAKSTQEITSTIANMVDRSQQATREMLSAEQLVENGVARADNADHAIRRIGDNAERVTNSISEISAAIKQQGAASNSIASKVEHTAQMSEESSAAAQHTAHSAEHLDQLAKAQIAILAQYTI